MDINYVYKTEKEDTLVWVSNIQGEFIVASAYVEIKEMRRTKYRFSHVWNNYLHPKNVGTAWKIFTCVLIHMICHKAEILELCLNVYCMGSRGKLWITLCGNIPSVDKYSHGSQACLKSILLSLIINRLAIDVATREGMLENYGL